MPAPIPEPTQNGAPSDLHHVRDSTPLKLPKPLGPRARRSLTQETSDLMRQRNQLDRALLSQAFRPLHELSTNDWPPRKGLLRQCARMASREREYIQARTRQLEERSALYHLDPSHKRALDVNLIKAQLYKFRRHLGPHLEAAEEARAAGGDDESGSAQDRADGSTASESSEDVAVNGSDDGEKPSNGLDGAFDDVRHSKKRKHSQGSKARNEPQKMARKERASARTQSPTSRTRSGKAHVPKRSKEMEASVSQIINSMSQTTSSQVSVNGASKVEAEKLPAEAATTNATEEKADQAATRTPASSTPSTPSDGAARPWYQRHAKATMRSDFNDWVREKPPHRRRPVPKKRRCQYLVSGAMPAPHLPSPRPGKANATSTSTDGP